jgi:NADPH:quinone reductase-like Zn-dependent oxidoreductase
MKVAPEKPDRLFLLHGASIPFTQGASRESKMKSWKIKKGGTSLEDLVIAEQAVPTPGPGELLIKVRACSLNYRDSMVLSGNYFSGVVDRDTTPLSCGAGEVVAIGADVTSYRVGDRVASTFFQGWLSGPATPHMGAALGAPPAAGMLSEYVVLPQFGVVPMASSLSFEEAATLPCAGVTAWNALMEAMPSVKPGKWVLVLGTGGVSILALQLAKAAGARVIVTSSSDAKLDRAKMLGADATINYRTIPSWGAEAARLSGGGVDHVVEVGGVGTLAESMTAVGFGGEIAFIGALTQKGNANARNLMFKAGRLRGVFVGSAAMARALNAAIDGMGIKPVVDKIFSFEEAKAAYAYHASPALFGKTIIQL